MPKQPLIKWTKKRLRKEADRVFSLFIRMRDRDDMGMTCCYTCSHKNRYNQGMQNGHFVPRQYLSLRYDETNCHAQCYSCNQLYNGQPSAYAQRLEKDYGKGTVAFLELKRKNVVIIDFDYISVINKYTPLIAKYNLK